MIRRFLNICLLVFVATSLCKSQDKIPSLEINYDSIRIILEQVYDRDQNTRRLVQDSLRLDSPSFNYYNTMLINVDNENQKIVLPLIENYGILPKSKIGEKANEAIFYVIQHSNVEIMDKYFLQYDSLARKGEANRIHAALMEDRLLMWKGLKQKYGTQASTINGKGNKYYIWPIDQPDKVDSLRKAVGLKATIREIAKELDAVYDPNLALPDKE